MRRGGKSLKKMKERAAQRRQDMIPHWLHNQNWEEYLEPINRFFKSHIGHYVRTCKCKRCSVHRMLKKKIDDLRFKEQKDEL